MTQKLKRMSNLNNDDTIETTEKAPTVEEGKELSLTDMLAGNDDSKSYDEQRGSKAREVIQSDEEEEQDEEQEDVPSVDASTISDEDRAAARLFFFGYDDTTAKLFSLNVYGNWDNSNQFRTYKNLHTPEYKDLIDSAAIVYKKWKFRWGPEVVIAVSLATNLGMKWQLAQKLKKDLKGGMASTDNIRNINKGAKQNRKGQAAQKGLL